MKKYIPILLLAFALLSCQQVRVMSYNIHASKGMDKVFDAKRIADVINEQDPDLVALQEVDRMTKRSGQVDVFAVLMEETGMYGVFMKTFNYDGGQFGNAVLSRYPIVDSELIWLPSRKHYEPRLLMKVVCVTDKGDTLYFYNTHLDHHKDDSDRPQQIMTVRNTIETGNKVILAGDFNCEPTSKELQYLSSKLTRSPGIEPTYPSDKPERNIDHVFYSDNSGIKFCSFRVIDEQVASDHRPVVAKFMIK